ncbi:nucleotide sugar dehydrogenase [Candidatus Woesearchaeota archaeon]|nr:nucleotide sugar dehydrogenase [Candidatus Woesearchaeota archaeon]
MRPEKICVLGMGFVGLTLSAVLADKKFLVTGVEVNKHIAAQLQRGEPHFHEKGLDVLLKKHIGKTLFIATEVPKEQYDVYVIAVGTPIDKQTKKPMLDYVINSAMSIKDVLTDGCLVILRSTVPVGVTRSVVKPILDQSGKKYHLAFCPERTAEGRAIVELRELPQIIGGLTTECVDKAMDLFRVLTPATVEVSSLEAAEMVKHINNAYRDLTFAFANEMALVCEKVGLNALDVIKAANCGYGRSNVPVPGFVGGACLEKDPHILMDFSAAHGYTPMLVKSSRHINETLPSHIVQKALSKLHAVGKDMRYAKVFVSGFAFKGQPETDDVRDSSTLRLLDALRAAGVTTIYGHDFVVSPMVIKNLHVIPCSLEEGFDGADCVFIANNHKSYYDLNIEKYLVMMRKPAVFMDCWQIFDREFCTVPGINWGGIGFD